MKLLQRAAWAIAFLAIVAGTVVRAADDDEQITVDATAGGVKLTASKIRPVGEKQMVVGYCFLETGEIRYTFSGNAPTTTYGTPLEPGTTLTITTNRRLSMFRAIRTGATSGTLTCTYSSDLP